MALANQIKTIAPQANLADLYSSRDAKHVAASAKRKQLLDAISILEGLQTCSQPRDTASSPNQEKSSETAAQA